MNLGVAGHTKRPHIPPQVPIRVPFGKKVMSLLGGALATVMA